MVPSLPSDIDPGVAAREAARAVFLRLAAVAMALLVAAALVALGSGARRRVEARACVDEGGTWYAATARCVPAPLRAERSGSADGER